jgi:hypothetical protein
VGFCAVLDFKQDEMDRPLFFQCHPSLHLLQLIQIGFPKEDAIGDATFKANTVVMVRLQKAVLYFQKIKNEIA